MGLGALLFPVTRDAVNGPASIVIIQKAVERVYTHAKCYGNVVFRYFSR
jgi:hypothetical protein